MILSAACLTTWVVLNMLKHKESTGDKGRFTAVSSSILSSSVIQCQLDYAAPQTPYADPMLG